MINASQFADALGRRRIAEANGVVLQAVSNAVVRGWFPSSWFLVCKTLADEANVECPPALFKMNEPDNTRNVDIVTAVSRGDAA